MGRKLTTYRRPSIAAMISTAPNMLALAAMREEITTGFLAGELNPSSGTVREWNVCLWSRVLGLMIDRPENATWIHNTVMGWDCPEALRAAVLETYRKLVAELPSDAERLRQRGIIIVGVTG